MVYLFLKGSNQSKEDVFHQLWNNVIGVHKIAARFYN